MASMKKSIKKMKGFEELVAQEYTINIHNCIHGMGFKKCAPQAIRKIWKSAMKVMGTPEVNINIRLNKTVWAKGMRDIPYHIHVRLSGKCNKDEDSPNKLYTLVTYVPVTTFKNLQSMWVRTNC
ncbi:60S ribosomal protein L31 [Tupaia chinensis]|uniref:Large ribosomal subunit protein eL31 n=1 Tax=Tupaia chinensis TaxID=246437 RepID=L9L3R8_TUPCH|nr:60S ribosomal protein L31 [Tupaia chinensis]